MKKIVLFFMALIYISIMSNTAKAESVVSDSFNIITNIFSNAGKNMGKSAQDMTSYSRQTRKTWGKNNEYKEENYYPPESEDTYENRHEYNESTITVDEVPLPASQREYNKPISSGPGYGGTISGAEIEQIDGDIEFQEVIE